MLVYGVGFHTSIQIILFFLKISPNHNNSYLRVFYSVGKDPIYRENRGNHNSQTAPFFLIY